MVDSNILLENKLVQEKWVPEGKERPPTAVSTDTRTVRPGELFIALKGPNFDGSDFACQALEKGAIGIVYSKAQEGLKELKKKYSDRYFLQVEDTYHYLRHIANLHMAKWQAQGGSVIGITGSNGKTTTKELLAFMMKGLIGDALFFSEGNLNNQIGVPLTVLKISPIHKFAIIEMGISEPKEMQILCEIALPNMGIITNIFGTHLESLESEEGVFQEKRVLYDYVMENSKNKGLFVLNADNEYLRRLAAQENVIFFGSNHGDYKISLHTNSVQFLNCEIKNTHLTGEHNFINLACAFLMARALFPEQSDELVKIASDFKPQHNRSSWVRLQNTDIFLDAYNANPTSMKAAILGFFQVVCQKGVDPSRVLWIIGDMNELGGMAEAAHRQLAQDLVGSFTAKHIVFIGRHYDFFQKGLGQSRCECEHFENIEAFKTALGKKYLHSFDMIFIKGSRSLQLESLVAIK